MSAGTINPTEMVATLINNGKNFVKGIKRAQDLIEGSCTILLLTENGIYAARDKFGRTPLALGEKVDPQLPPDQQTLVDPPYTRAVTMETNTFPTLGYKYVRQLGPGEIVLINENGFEQCSPPKKRLQICAFFWVYYGFGASSYEGINVEEARYRCGAALARNDDVKPDIVAGVPDSGTAWAPGALLNDCTSSL